MTFFCKANKEGYCYIWPETEGDLSADVFASIQQIHFRRLITDGFLKDVGFIIMYSDGANYQNRCATIADAFLLMVNVRHNGNTKISDKGTYADGMRQCPRNHREADKVSGHRRTTGVCHGRQVGPCQSTAVPCVPDEKTNFMRLTIPLLNSIRPGNKRGDPTTYDIRALILSRWFGPLQAGL
jgi:hypothetical protein